MRKSKRGTAWLPDKDFSNGPVTLEEKGLLESGRDSHGWRVVLVQSKVLMVGTSWGWCNISEVGCGVRSHIPASFQAILVFLGFGGQVG